DPTGWFGFFPPLPYGPTIAPVDIAFQETVTPPQNAALGTYVFNVKAVADGATRATQTLTVNVVGDAVSGVRLSVDEASRPAGIARAPFADIPVGRIPYFAGSTTSSTPFGATPYGATPFGATPYGATPYQQVLLSQLPLVNPADGATWPQVLTNTSFAGRPLNAITLADVLG